MSRKSFFCSWAQNIGVRIFFFKCALNDYNSASSYLLNQFFKKKLSFFFICQCRPYLWPTMMMINDVRRRPPDVVGPNITTTGRPTFRASCSSYYGNITMPQQSIFGAPPVGCGNDSRHYAFLTSHDVHDVLFCVELGGCG